MPTLTDRTITALRSNHDKLAALVPTLTDAQLTGGSGATEWSVADVLSHMGSGAEIALAGLSANIGGQELPGQDFNQSVWDRWNAMAPADQASNFVDHNAKLVEALEGLSTEQRETSQIKLPFLPAAVPVSTIAGMRLNEAVLHSWDVQAGLDPSTTLDPEAAELLAEHLTGGLSFLLGFVAKPDQLSEPAVLDLNGVGLEIGDGVVTSSADPTATFHGPPEAAVRLLTGRLGPTHTPAEVSVSGNVSLEDLRKVFPGF